MDRVVGRLVRDLRQDHDVSVKAAAARLGWSERRLDALERGKRRITFRDAIEVAAAFDMPLEEFHQEALRRFSEAGITLREDLPA